MRFMIAACLAPLFLCLSLSAPLASAADRPNIVFIMTDDQAPWAVGTHDGHTHADTPNLDDLFRQGVTLSNSFVVTPVCSPSRASLATSRYGSEVGISDWLHPREEPEHGLSPGTVTWYERLRQAGYCTGLIGKWHLGLEDKHHPTRMGFDHFMGFRGGGRPPANPTLEKEGEEQEFEGLTTDILTDHALEFLRCCPSDQPFLMVVHYRAPHARWLPVAPEDWEPFEELDPQLPHPDYPGLDVARAKQMTREYLASVRGVDRNVGRLMQALDEGQLADDTVVIFTSDHGYNMAHNGIWHKGNGHWLLTDDALPEATENIPQGQRPNMYDASLKVPTAVRWPGVTEAETTITSSITNLDWYPTMLAIAGVDPGEDEVVRGRDLSELLAGKTAEWNDDVFTQYSTRHQSRTHMRSYRTGDWKLIRDFLNPERDELFDLRNDPEETTNVIGVEDHADVVAELDAKLIERMAEIDDPVLEIATDAIGTP